MVGNAIARRVSRRQAVGIAVVLMSVGVIAAGTLLQASPAEQSKPVSSPAPTTQPSSPVEAEWAPLDLAPVAAVATLQPSSQDDAGVSPDATFTLASLTGEPASTLAERLEVSPPTEFTVAAADGTASATIIPTSALATGDTYRFALRSPDGAVTGSWAFRVRGPVRVIGTIPGDAATFVPVRTGIELTFDQEGVADMADHFSIEPAVEGTFERHGRTQVFVPKALAQATTYTVTVRKGLARTGTDLALSADVVVRFETEGPGTQEERLEFGRAVIEAAPGEPLAISLFAIRPWVDDRQLPAPTRSAFRIYRFASLDDASRALTDFLAAPRWAQYSIPQIATGGLAVAGAFSAPLEPLRDSVLLVRVPVALDQGWYVIEIPGDHPAQAFLQITPVSAWVSVMSDRTVAWVNDVITHQAIEGATIAVGADTFATSDLKGLAIGDTPRALLPPAAGGDADAPSPILRVGSPSGDVVLVPFNVSDDGPGYRGEWWETFGSADETYWSLLYTDRSLYRRTDRIEVWGYLRGREDGRTPPVVQVRLAANGAGSDQDIAAITSLDVRPGPDGVFTASLPITALPFGSYEVQAIVDGRLVTSRWLEVSIIRKPPYQLRLTTDHAAVITGSPVTVTATATFFDATPVAGLALNLSSTSEDVPRRVRTDANGTTSTTFTLATTSTSYRDSGYLQASPAGPESGEVYSSASPVIFPSAYQLTAAAILTGDALQLTGNLTAVDLVRVERALAAGTWNGDALGPPVGGVRIDATITELIPTRRQIGSEYDFLEKIVRPVYEHDFERRAIGSVTVQSGADGTFSVSTPIPNSDHQYDIVLTTRDQAGRVQTASAWASPSVPSLADTGIQFLTPENEGGDEAAYGIGAMVAWRMVDDGRDLPTGGEDRYLYIIAQRGLRAAVVTDSPRFRHRFAEADAPGIFVMGVHFTGTTYAPKASSWANYDQEQRRIRVQITADRERYRPGETAVLSVRTTLPDGSAVAASVVLQAVDEKLFALGGAMVPSPLGDLYARVDSGIVRLTATHQVPTMAGPEGEGGDTSGGGGDGLRTDFRDTLVFRELRTDAAGRATTRVRLSDDLTSWHVAASAVAAGLEAGAGDMLIPVGLPFFVELTVADSYQLLDRPAVQVRAFGDALRAGDRVDFTVASAPLGLAETRIAGKAFEPIRVALPPLSLGTQSLSLTARASARKDDSGNPLTDGLTATFEVVGSRFTANQAVYGLVADGLPAVPGGAEQSLWTFADAGRGQLVPLLTTLAEPAGLRLDRALAQAIAADLLVTEFGRDQASIPPSALNGDLYSSGPEYDEDGLPVRYGVSLVPSGGVDPWLATRVALMAPGSFDTDLLQYQLRSIVDDPETSRDLQIAALAGLSSLGEPVLGDLLEARREPQLTATEQLYLALGFEAVGDDASALTIERDLLGRFGERLGRWVRLRLDRTEDGADATALLAVIAAGLGDPLAADMAAYAWTYPAGDAVNTLELAAYAKRSLDRTPAAEAAFAYTVDGRRSVVRLQAGEAFSIRLLAVQAASLSVETLSGSVAAVVEARVPVSPSRLQPHPDLNLVREPVAEPVPADSIVEVNLTATFGSRAPEGCYEVSEVVPSGLAPLEFGRGQTDERGIIWPSSVNGQQVGFCAGNDRTKGPVARLRYLARVVNEGTFAWDPAIMQLPAAPDMLAITPAGTVTIGRR